MVVYHPLVLGPIGGVARLYRMRLHLRACTPMHSVLRRFSGYRKLLPEGHAPRCRHLRQDGPRERLYNVKIELDIYLRRNYTWSIPKLIIFELNFKIISPRSTLIHCGSMSFNVIDAIMNVINILINYFLQHGETTLQAFTHVQLLQCGCYVVLSKDFHDT